MGQKDIGHGLISVTHCEVLGKSLLSFELQFLDAHCI